MLATLRKRFDREDEGFTLIELMVVVLIIAILLAIAIPTFLAHGRQDPIPLESSLAVARAPNTTCLELEDCGHVPYVEQPGLLFPPLLAFLREPAAIHPLVT